MAPATWLTRLIMVLLPFFVLLMLTEGGSTPSDTSINQCVSPDADTPSALEILQDLSPEQLREHSTLSWKDGNITFSIATQDICEHPLPRNTTLGPYILLNGTEKEDATKLDFMVDLYDIKHQNEDYTRMLFDHLMVNIDASLQDLEQLLFPPLIHHDELKRLSSRQPRPNLQWTSLQVYWSLEAKFIYTLALISPTIYGAAAGFLTALIFNLFDWHDKALKSELQAAALLVVTTFVIQIPKHIKKALARHFNAPQFPFFTDCEAQTFVLILGKIRQLCGCLKNAGAARGIQQAVGELELQPQNNELEP